jgi:hypothetical protein
MNVPTTQQFIPNDTATVTCDWCGKQCSLPDLYSMMAWVPLPGPTGLAMQQHPPSQCDAVQHFGCTWEHVSFATITCILEHLPTKPHAGDANTPNIVPIAEKLNQQQGIDHV